MGVVIRQSFKSTLVTYTGVALGAINLLYFFPKVLTAEEIGLRDVIISVAMSLSIFTQLGLQSAMSRFFPYFKDESRQHHGFLLLCLGIAAVGWTFFGGIFWLLNEPIAWLFAQNSAQVNQYLWLILPFTAVMMLQNIFEIWARLHFRIVVNALIREIFLRFSQTILVVAYARQIIDFHQFLLLFTASYLLAVVLLLIYLKKLGVLFLSPRFFTWQPALMREMARYSTWMMIGGAGVVINERIDGVMLASLAGLSLTGIYSISFFIGTIIDMPRRAVGQIAGTLVAQHWKDRNYEAIARLYKQASLNQLILGGTLFLGVWVNIDAIFSLIPNGEIYRPGKYVVLFIGLSRLLDMANGINSEIILNSPYYRFNLGSILFLGLISFTTNYFMIPLYGLVGAAAGSTLSILLFNVLKGGFIWHKMKAHPFEKRSVYVVTLLSCTYGVNLLLPSFGNTVVLLLAEMVVRGAVVLGLITWGVWKFKLSDELSELLTTQIAKRLLKKR